MRLICENCDAQYEVDKDMVPPEGRDVQCSACGHIWFQPAEGTAAPSAAALPSGADNGPEDLAALMEAELNAGAGSPPDRLPSATSEALHKEGVDPLQKGDAPPHSDDNVFPAANSLAGATAAGFAARSARRDAEAGIPPLSDDETEEDEAASSAESEADLPPLRRPRLDDDMMAILREEAERETAARAAEAAPRDPRGFEHQPELGLAEPPSDLRLQPSRPRRVEPATSRPATAASFTRPDDGFDDAEIITDDTSSPPRPQRRDLLPDIEQINSTLDGMPGQDYMAGEALSPPPGRSSFARGFVVALLLWAIAAVTYLQAPQLREALPAAGPALDSYTGFVDRSRSALDRLVSGLI